MNKKEQREYNRKYYQEHKKDIIKKIRGNQIANNYKTEKTPEARKIRTIKRKTRSCYSLEDKKCELCGRKATEHHHTTSPIQYDKFLYLCHDCHMEIHRMIREAEDGQ